MLRNETLTQNDTDTDNKEEIMPETIANTMMTTTSGENQA
jgi:hypothetical protein